MVMVMPVQVTFRNMDASPAVEADVLRRAASLERYHPRLQSCRIVVEAPHRHRRKGAPYRVRLDMIVPGAEVVAGRNPSEHAAHADVYVAVRDAFRAARRELMDELRRTRDTLAPEPPVRELGGAEAIEPEAEPEPSSLGSSGLGSNTVQRRMGTAA